MINPNLNINILPKEQFKLVMPASAKFPNTYSKSLKKIKLVKNRDDSIKNPLSLNTDRKRKIKIMNNNNDLTVKTRTSE